ncbi:large ribosomal subunit protein eL22-like isoform X2 [Bacillus rossius redtenbacheri]
MKAAAGKGRQVHGKRQIHGKNQKKPKKVTQTFVVDCTRPFEDGILDMANFEKYLKERLKVNGKTNNLGTAVTLERAKGRLSVNASVPFSKRYLKYMTKKYLKKNNLRDWLRVVSPNKKDTYEVRYFQINQEEEDDDADDK